MNVNFEHGEVINYALDGESITPSHDKNTGVLPNSVAVEEGNCSGISPWEKNDFKTVTEFNGCDRRKLRMDQQHCSYSTVLT